MAKENIKVKTLFGAHQIYQEIVNYPPKGVEYSGAGKQTKQGKYYENKKWKEFIGRWMQRLHLPRMAPVWGKGFDIIHSSRGIIPLTKKPWVMDIEHVHSFFGLDPNPLKKKRWKKFIEKTLSKKNCKAILCHCEATRQAFFEYLDCTQFKEKIHVLYPSSHTIPLKKETHTKLRFLCILSLFFHKGGPQVLKAFTQLEEKYPGKIELVMRADVPPSLKQKYNSKHIIYTPYFGNIVPREKLIREAYSSADVFIYPTFCDSFGYSLIDALVSGLPIITTNLFASPEIVKENFNGLIVDIPGYSLAPHYEQKFPWKNITGKTEDLIVRDLKEKMETLLVNKTLIKTMGKNSFYLISKGNFSIEHRNKKLKKIYEEALK